MKRFLFFACAWLVFALDVSAQSRRDEYDPSAALVTSTSLDLLRDGGCSVRWCVEVPSQDGGYRLRGCEDRELVNATNRARCSAIIAAGAPIVLRSLRFNVDGGAP